MVKLREKAEVVEIEIIKRPVKVFKEVWLITSDDIGKPIDYIDSEEFLEALSLLSIEG